ncbi:MAG: tRNA threonylcarbamoyladenosine biosynthesis protein TsaB [Flavobacteriales bacterium]|jgi:tRNA threonylcarbamoyladenosine biosynthesis protein TsaB
MPINDAALNPNGASLDALIALDASAEACSASLLYQGQIVSRSSDEPRAHAKALLPMVDSILTEAGISLNQLDGLAFTAGPGSFTGLRIATSVIQGLAYGSGLPAYAVTSLQALAIETLRNSGDWQSLTEPCLVIPVFDARMKELYWSAELWNGTVLESVQSASLSSIDEARVSIAKIIAENRGLNIVGVGHAWSQYDIDQSGLNAFDASSVPQAESVVIGLSSQALTPTVFQRPQDIEPLYLRNEVTWKKRTRIRSADESIRITE